MNYNGKPDIKDFKQRLANDKELNEILNRKTVRVKGYVSPFDFIEGYIGRANVGEDTRKDYANTVFHLKAFDEYRGRTGQLERNGL